MDTPHYTVPSLLTDICHDLHHPRSSTRANAFSPQELVCSSRFYLFLTLPLPRFVRVLLLIDSAFSNAAALACVSCARFDSMDYRDA